MKFDWSLERVGFVLLAAGLGLIQFSIKSEIILGGAPVI